MLIREHVYAAGTTAGEGRLGETHASCLLPALPPPSSQRPRIRTLGSGSLGLARFFVLGFYVDFCLSTPENRVYLIPRCK